MAIPFLLGRRRQKIDHLADNLIESGWFLLQLLGPRKTQKVVGNLDEALAFVLQALNSIGCLAFAGVLRLGKILGEQLQIQIQRADMVLDLVDETTRELGEFVELLGGRHG